MFNKPVQSVTPADAAAWLDAGKAILIDVREPHEFASGHVSQAKSVPLGRIEADIRNVGVKEGQRVVVMCLSGGRSARACPVVASKFPGHEVFNLSGGITAWKGAGLPVVA